MAAVSRTAEALSYAASFGAYYAFVALCLRLRLAEGTGLISTLARTFVGGAEAIDRGKKPASPSLGKARGSGTSFFGSKAVRLISCVVGIKGSYLCWGCTFPACARATPGGSL